MLGPITHHEPRSFEKNDEAVILVVDDSPLERALAAGLLRKEPTYRVLHAESGREALAGIAHQLPDVVLTDLVMPGMDGLELIAQIRERHPHLPVVLMTAYGNESVAVDALQQGAASYVPKAKQAERLMETIARVLRRARSAQRRRDLMQSATGLICTFELDSDLELVPPLVDLAQEVLLGTGLTDAHEAMRVGVALEESLLNAMLHGSLGITTAELDEARGGRLGIDPIRLVALRRQAAQQDSRIIVHVQIDRESARFVIRDPGPGFDARTIMQTEMASRFECGAGRGLMLVEAFMDGVYFNQAGNEVTLVKKPLRDRGHAKVSG